MNPLIKPLLLTATMVAALASTPSVNAHQQRFPEQRLEQRAQMQKARIARAAKRHPELAVAMDFRRLERLYRHTGQQTQVVAMYQDLLKRTEHPRLRAFAERRLQRAERLANPERTVAELRARIDEKLSKLR